MQLRNYRGVAKSDVSFSLNGVTIVEGPNEAGKTAISEGLQMAIDLPDSSRSAQVRAVQPVGHDAGPEVEISLSSGKYELVYLKRWLRQPQTTLEVQSPRRESLTGREAHDRLKAILDETLDVALWGALRIEQGTTLLLPNFDLPSMGRALDRAAGGDIATDRGETLWTRICEERDKYWTATGQVTGERRSLEQSVQEAKGTVAELTTQLQDIDSDAAQLSRLSDESARLSDTRKECEERELELDQRWNAMDRLRSEVERLEAIHSAAEAQRVGASSEWQRRQNLVATRDASTEALAALQAEAEDAAPGRETATRRRKDATTALRDADAALRGAQERLSRAIADRDYLRQLIEVDQLKERHDRYLAAEQTLEQAEAYLELARVDDDVAKQIEEAYIEDERAKSAAGSAAASVEVTALRDLTVEVGDDFVELAVNEVNRSLVEDEVVLAIPNVARMRVSAGPESKGLADQRRKTQETYRRLCKEVGVADVAEARSAAQERQDAQREKEEAVTAIARELRDLTSDVLLGKVKSLTERVTSYPKERPEHPPSPTDLNEAQQIEAETAILVTACDGELRTCADAAKNAENELKRDEIAEAARAARIKIAHGSSRDAADRLALDREGQADDALIAAVAATQEKEARDRKSLDGAKVQLSDADPDSVEALLDNAREATKRAIDEAQSNRDDQTALRSSLDLRGERGLQTTYDEADSQLDHVVREYERQESRANAAWLLHETFAKYRQQAHQHYIEPFKECIDQLGRIVFGSTFAVELDEDLRVVRRTLDGTMLDVDQLSTGAREQIGVLCRLACATIVNPQDGGAPVMIDDALGWSDPQRLQGMGAAIAAAGKQCQVIVLTCTPGRYSHVGNAQVVSL